MSGLYKATFSKVSQGIKGYLNSRASSQAAASLITTLTAVQKELTALSTSVAGLLKGSDPEVSGVELWTQSHPVNLKGHFSKTSAFRVDSLSGHC
jgi:hypothetical protein